MWNGHEVAIISSKCQRMIIWLYNTTEYTSNNWKQTLSTDIS